MRILTLVLSLVVPTIGLADDWTPPENPDPSVILQEARSDAADGNYEVALTKQLWYHQNAVKLDRGQSGVRRSFALSHWLDLGEKYPPALERLRQIRNETEKKIRDENRVRVNFDDFHDFTALNDTLREEERTSEVFKWLSETDAEDAKRVYGISEAALIKQKEYELCGKYIDPEEDVSQIGDSYTLGLTMTKQFGQHHLDFVEKKVVNEAAMLVAILVVNNRLPEASKAAEKLKGFVTDTELSKNLELALDDALNGTVPTPWP